VNNTGAEGSGPPAAPGAAGGRLRRPGGGLERPLVGRASALLTPRDVAFGVLAVALGLYYRFHESLPNTSTWGDVAFLSFVLMPAVLALVYLVLPLRAAKEVQLLLVAAAFAVVAVVLHQADLDALADFAKLGAMAFAAFWFLGFFEALSWVVLVACIVPWVDAYSVWRGPTNHIVHNHRQVFSTLSFAFPVPGEASAANLGLPDLLFFSLFLAAAARFGLRVFLTWVLLTASFGGTIAIAVAWNKPGLPALPLLSLGFVLANADLLWERLRLARSTKTESA
jgi:hypothetical protein